MICSGNILSVFAKVRLIMFSSKHQNSDVAREREHQHQGLGTHPHPPVLNQISCIFLLVNSIADLHLNETIGEEAMNDEVDNIIQCAMQHHKAYNIIQHKIEESL